LSLSRWIYANVLVGVIKIEEKIQKYYIDPAEASKSLMADFLQSLKG